MVALPARIFSTLRARSMSGRGRGHAHGGSLAGCRAVVEGLDIVLCGLAVNDFSVGTQHDGQFSTVSSKRWPRAATVSMETVAARVALRAAWRCLALSCGTILLDLGAVARRPPSVRVLSTSREPARAGYERHLDLYPIRRSASYRPWVGARCGAGTVGLAAVAWLEATANLTRSSRTSD